MSSVQVEAAARSIQVPHKTPGHLATARPEVLLPAAVLILVPVAEVMQEK